MESTHIGLVIMNAQNTKLIEAKYLLSKFSRELGDKINIDNKTYTVGIIGDTRQVVIKELNSIIKIQNKLNRKKMKKKLLNNFFI
tara:strand:- start:2137 stop:2391 length:255 start_codon:yes stop_codon:yes gene_type:complete